MTDLPITPCYEGKNCGSKYNCGELCDDTGVIGVDTICSGGTFRGDCWGNDSNECSGIQSCCLDDGTSCTDDTGVALNGYGVTMGCDNFSTDECGTGSKSSCMEFRKEIDQLSPCETPCWKNGGQTYIKRKCETEIGDNKDVCKAMEYFCDWDPESNICTNKDTSGDNPPFEKFPSKYSLPIQTLLVKNDCAGLSETECIEIPGVEENRYYVNSAQSSWSSTQQTSFDPYSRINCVYDTESETKAKVCITLPRCQFVDTPNECGLLTDDFGESLFSCGKTQYLNVNETNNKFGSGYCTWCKGTQSGESFEIPEHRADFLIGLDKGIIPITRDPVDWSSNSQNRCNNYNECEVNDSEEMWNECIYDESNGEYGVNYNSPQYKNANTEERKELLQTKGFCVSEASEAKRTLINKCETKLETMGSLNWGRVFGPDTEEEACQYRYNWEHYCIEAPNGGQLAENYLCTWCPSLQCKIGSKNEICSETSDNTDYCDTDSSHGVITPKAIELGAPENCGCFLKIMNESESESFFSSISGFMKSVYILLLILLILLFGAFIYFYFFKYRV
jgi:hypothetical protein